LRTDFLNLKRQGEGGSASMPAALRPQDISDHFAELAAAHDGDPTMT
jgi:hypothetical protein